MKPSPYSVHPGVAMALSVVAKMKEKTGRTLDEWIALVNKHGPATEKERREWLKREHQLGTNYAAWIAERANGKGAEDSDPDAYLRAADRYVNGMFAGTRAQLRPIYNELLKVALSVAEDVKACPCKTIVPLYRKHVFAEIKPSTRTRIDFGLALAKFQGELPERLIDTGGLAKKDRITHRFAITSLADIDVEVKRWLKTAYDLD